MVARSVALLLPLCWPAIAQAALVWSDDFTGQIDGGNPTTDFAGGAVGADWTLGENGGTVNVSVTTAVGVLQPSLFISDTITSAPEGTATVTNEPLRGVQHQPGGAECSPLLV